MKSTNPETTSTILYTKKHKNISAGKGIFTGICKSYRNSSEIETRATLSVALNAQQMHLHGITFTTWKEAINNL